LLWLAWSFALSQTGKKSKGVEAVRKTRDSESWPKEGSTVRSRLWSLILRELPYPLRWLALEVSHVLSWLDRSFARLLQGFRESPAWYFVTVVGTFAVLLTIGMFISLIKDNSRPRPQGLASRSKTNLSRRELELIHEWTVQDHWRVAHLFVPEQPAPIPRDIPLDSRLFASRKTTSCNVHGRHSSDQRPLAQQSDVKGDFDVRLDLNRPKKAQQDRRTITGTVLNSSTDLDHQLSEPRIQKRDSRLLVQAAWEFSSDCNRFDSVSVPIRRPIPIPLPMPELPSVPVYQNHPDLAFEMAMERHFTTTGKFPPGSHLVHQSDLSVFPENIRRFPSELVSHEDVPWKWRSFQLSPHTPFSKVIPYKPVGAVSRSEPQDSEPTDEYNETLRAVAEVALRIELFVPGSISAGEPTQSALLISNEGPDAVSQIEVTEFLPSSQTVIDASPAASCETSVELDTNFSAKMWHRQFPELLPGTEHELTLKWISGGSHRLIHRAQVIARAEISTNTDVSRPPEVQQMPSIPPERIEYHPALACDIQYLDRVHVGDDVEMEITVRNTGDVTLHDVKFEIEFPSQFSHQEGQTVIFEAGNLAVRGQKATVLKFSAVEAGEAVNFIRLTSAEHVHASGSNTIEVAERRQEKKSVIPVEEPLPINSPNNRNHTNPATSHIPPDAKRCCCQKLQAPRLEPVARLP
jgi:hypothetical protein